MKKRTVALLLALVLVLGAAVGGTVAWLVSTPDAVTNTFTVGNVQINLDEAPVDAEGKATSGARVIKNNYLLLPGSEYDKDPTVHVVADSEACYVFVKVENALNTQVTFDNGKTLAAAIEAHGWTKLSSETNVWYKTVSKSTSQQDLVVFESFKVLETANYEALDDNEGKQIVVTAYAIQQANLATAEAAWTAGGWT